jgi:hypothetical protein
MFIPDPDPESEELLIRIPGLKRRSRIGDTEFGIETMRIQLLSGKNFPTRLESQRLRFTWRQFLS